MLAFLQKLNLSIGSTCSEALKSFFSLAMPVYWQYLIEKSVCPAKQDKNKGENTKPKWQAREGITYLFSIFCDFF
jgi:hypothetical protein